MSTDSDLIRRSYKDPAIFAGLYDKYAVGLYRYAARRAGPFAAEDVLSETFLTAFQVRDSFDHAWADARPWLFGIATNHLRRHHRSETRILAIAARAAPRESQASHDEMIDAQLDAAAHTGRLALALQDLSAEDRESLLLYAWADLTYEQIAEATHVPIGTVRSRLNRARRVLKSTHVEDDPHHLEELNHG